MLSAVSSSHLTSTFPSSESCPINAVSPSNATNRIGCIVVRIKRISLLNPRTVGVHKDIRLSSLQQGATVLPIPIHPSFTCSNKNSVARYIHSITKMISIGFITSLKNLRLIAPRPIDCPRVNKDLAMIFGLICNVIPCPPMICLPNYS